MDALYFKTFDPELLLTELGLHGNPEIQDGKYFNGSIYECATFLLVWLGKRPEETDPETGDILSWHDGELFNVWVRGQQTMDFFTDLRSAVLMPAPESPDLTIF